jgi:tetrapyrrole methylase family protein / MazG family protein
MRPDKRSMGEFAGLRRLIAILRGPDGCPWDRVQTHDTLRPYLLEETSETLEAIDSGDPAKMSEELGDLLFQVLIHVQLAEEAGAFTMRDVLRELSEKLVNRHPHVFGDAVAKTPDAVVEQWDDLKARERGGRPAMEGIPRALPAVAYAQAIQRRAARAGFAFATIDQAWEAVDEELQELRRAGTTQERRDELGDAIFALTNLGRELDIDAEEALRSTCRGFIRLFEQMEQIVQARGLDLKQAPLDEKLALWEEAKTLSK